MEYIKQLREQRYKANEDAKAVLSQASTEKRELSGEEREKIDKIYTAMDGLKADIERAERAEAETRNINDSIGRKVIEGPASVRSEAETRRLATQAWALRGRPNLVTEEMAKAAAACGVDLDSMSLDSGKVSQRALQVATATSGGNAVQNERMGDLYEYMKWFGHVRSLAQVITTETGATFPIPTVSDTANSASITTESSTISSSTDPAFAQATLSAYKYVSPIVKVSIELLRDATFDVNGYLARALGTRLARAQNADFTSANGSSKPAGVVYGATATTAAATNAFTMDEVIGLTHAVDPAYRQGAVLMAHDTTIKGLRTLKDTTNQYLWQPSLQVGAPDVFNGFPVHANNDMDSALTTGKQLFLFGNLGVGYIIRDVGAPKFERNDSVYWATQEVGFLAFQFSDAKVLDATAIKRLQLA